MLNPFRFIIWNIQGASLSDSLKYLHKICVDNAISLVILLEPMSDIKKVKVVRRRLHLDHGLSFLNSKVWFL